MSLNIRYGAPAICDVRDGELVLMAVKKRTERRCLPMRAQFTELDGGTAFTLSPVAKLTPLLARLDNGGSMNPTQRHPDLAAAREMPGYIRRISLSPSVLV